jgi:hypothetical protein
MPITKATASSIAPAAKGDLVVGSATNDASVLTVGSANQVLTVDSSTATGLKWAAASTGAMTKIAGNTFSAQSSVAIDSVFSSTYRRYMAVLSVTSSVQNAVLQMQYRYAGPTTQTADYYGSFWRIDRNNAGTGAGYANVAQMTLDTHLNNTGGTQFPLTVWFSNVGNSSTQALIYGQGQTSIAQSATLFAGYVDTQRTYTGFLIKPDSGTITGSYAVYGLEN